MFEVIKKAWKETFYPQISVPAGQVSFFGGAENPSFLYYFWEYPHPESLMAYKIFYFIGLGFILFPLKNIIKSVIEFPLTLMSLTLEEVKRGLSFIPRVDLLFFIPTAILSTLRYIVGLILSPTFSQYRIQSLTNNPNAAGLVYFLSTLFAILLFRNTISPIILNALERRFPNFFESGWPLLRWLSIVHSTTASMNIQINNLSQEAEGERVRFLGFADFDPNKTRCSISGKPLGFLKEESDTIDMVVMRYKERDTIKYALLTELLPSEYRTAPLSVKEDLIVNLRGLDPLKDYVQVPSQLTIKFDPSLECNILGTVLTADQNPVRSIYGHYYSKAGVLPWLEKKGTCPISRSALKPEDLRPVEFEMPRAERASENASNASNASNVSDRSNQQSRASWLEKICPRISRFSFFRNESSINREELPNALPSLNNP